MTTVHKSEILNFSAAQMFALVEDVENYPTFLPWCTQAYAQRSQDNCSAHATIVICFCGITQQFSTNNTLIKDKHIAMQLANGPFKRLNGQWRFIALSENQCRVELDLEYEFSQFLFEKLLGPVFDVASRSMVMAFCEQARKIYG